VLSSGTVKVAGQKQAVARSQLGNSDGLQVCQCVARNTDVSWNPLNVDTGGFVNGREVRPD